MRQSLVGLTALFMLVGSAVAKKPAGQNTPPASPTDVPGSTSQSTPMPPMTRTPPPDDGSTSKMWRWARVGSANSGQSSPGAPMLPMTATPPSDSRQASPGKPPAAPVWKSHGWGPSKVGIWTDSPATPTPPAAQPPQSDSRQSTEETPIAPMTPPPQSSPNTPAPAAESRPWGPPRVNIWREYPVPPAPPKDQPPTSK